MLHTYNSIRNPTIDAIADKLALLGPGAMLRATGHSMGASMVELLCVDLAIHSHAECASIYTFGTPRSGNQAFVDALATATPSRDVWRVTHWRDPVPHLPPTSFGYVHAPTEVFYNYDCSTVRQCSGSDDKNCSAQFSTVACLVCCVMEHLHYMNQTIGKAQCQ